MDLKSAHFSKSGLLRIFSLDSHVLKGGEHVSLLQQPGGRAEADEPHEVVGVAAAHGEHRLAARAVQVCVACA